MKNDGIERLEKTLDTLSPAQRAEMKKAISAVIAGPYAAAVAMNALTQGAKGIEVPAAFLVTQYDDHGSRIASSLERLYHAMETP